MSRTLVGIGLLVVLSVVPRAAGARCAGQFTRTFPEDGAAGVPTNTGVVIVFGDTRGVAGALPVLRLTSPRDRAVALVPVLDQEAGDGFRAQRTIALSPERPLRPGTEYHLSARLGAHGRVRLTFRTGPGADLEAPRLRAARAGRFEVLELGCGPAHEVPLLLDGAADDRAAPFVRVRLARSAADLAARRLAGDVLVTRAADGTARLGHGMCFGNWPLEPGDRFVAVVSVVDAALHESAPSGPIAIEAR